MPDGPYGFTVTMTRLVLAVALALAACSHDTRSTESDHTASIALPAGMVRVTDPSQVCMVNDQFMGSAQIPVTVGSRTYFGCCPACKDKLETQPGARTAQDPVTGEPVDKASAVIVKDASGKVLYFASEHTLRRFRG